jgi:hypothetical protein
MQNNPSSKNYRSIIIILIIALCLMLTLMAGMVLILLRGQSQLTGSGEVSTPAEVVIAPLTPSTPGEPGDLQGGAPLDEGGIPLEFHELFEKDSLWLSPFSISIAAIHQVTPVDETALAEYRALPEEERVNAPFPSLLEALVTSGATGTRVEIKWKQIQKSAPVPGQPTEYDWKWNDNKLGLIGEAGVQMLATIEFANEWTVDPGLPACGPTNPAYMDDLVEFVTALVTRYKEPPYNIKFWELDNEPDSTVVWGADIGQGCWGFYGDRYVDMLSHAYAAIKEVDPQATVVMGGLAYDFFIEYGGNFERSFPDAVMSAGGHQYFDIQNIHYFTDFRHEWERWNLRTPTCGSYSEFPGLPYEAGGIDVLAKVNHYKNRMLTCHGVDKPLWLTEIAASSGREGNHDLDWQARYVPQVYARSLSLGVENITWYGLTTPNQTDEQGLLFEDFRPKPSFFAYQTMTSQLMGFQFIRTIHEPGNIEGYAFVNSTGEEKYVLWRDEAITTGNVAFSLSPAGQVKVVDYLGNESLVLDGGAGDLDGAQNGLIFVEVSEIPLYITIVDP